MTQYGGGIGGTYETATVYEDSPTGRNEKIITRIVEGRRVTITVRGDIAPTDPLLLLVRASLYSKVVSGAPFPVPPTPRKIKEALLRVAS